MTELWLKKKGGWFCFEFFTAKNTVISSDFLVEKLCPSAKFPHQKIRWNYGIFRSVTWKARFVYFYLMFVWFSVSHLLNLRLQNMSAFEFITSFQANGSFLSPVKPDWFFNLFWECRNSALPWSHPHKILVQVQNKFPQLMQISSRQLRVQSIANHKNIYWALRSQFNYQ